MAIPDLPEMDMEKRLLLAMVLSMAVLFLFLYRQPPQPPQPPPTEQAIEVEETSPSDSGRELLPPEAAEVEPTRVAHQIIEIENENLLLRWSNRGGILLSARLKNYPTAEGNPLEIIPQKFPELQRQTLGIRVGDERLDQRLREAVYEVSGVSGSRVRAPAEITLHYRDSVIEVSRKIRLPEAGYLVEMETEVYSQGRSIPFSVLLGPGIGEGTPSDQGDFAQPQAAYYLDGSVQRHSRDDLDEEPIRFNRGARWVAFDSKFFAYILLNPGGILGGRIARGEPPQGTPAGEEIDGPLLLVEVEMEAGARYSAFLGPKAYQVLETADATLGQLIDYGWFTFLVRPLLFSLNFIYQYLHNYGLAIILLTFGINLVLFPVRYKQMASMKKMSELQPQMKSIQDRYKRMKRTDPRKQKMNEEVMALYKKHGVNPLGGCLPLVIQMPFLFAFYRMLYSSIELRGAPFMGWIQDLSQQDPYYITPILMGVSMVVQQKMSPAAGDPTQRKMMMILPVVFTFFFLSFSSGLVLYFLFSNLFGMMFQFSFQRWQDLAQEVPAKKPTKKR